MGQPYVDAGGQTFAALLGVPVAVLQGDVEVLRRTARRSVERGLDVAVYDRGMFATGNDDDNRAVVASRASAELDLVGVAVAGAARDVDRAADRCRMLAE